MPKYCMEREPPGVPVIHDERCSALDLATQLSCGWLHTLGEHANPRDALVSVRATSPGALLCPVCGRTPGEVLRKAITARPVACIPVAIAPRRSHFCDARVLRSSLS